MSKEPLHEVIAKQCAEEVDRQVRERLSRFNIPEQINSLERSLAIKQAELDAAYRATFEVDRAGGDAPHAPGIGLAAWIKCRAEMAQADKERLDWLQSMTQGYGKGWICRMSTTGRGYRLHEASVGDCFDSVREAIDKVRKESCTMEKVEAKITIDPNILFNKSPLDWEVTVRATVNAVEKEIRSKLYKLQEEKLKKCQTPS